MEEEEEEDLDLGEISILEHHCRKLSTIPLPQVFACTVYHARVYYYRKRTDRIPVSVILQSYPPLFLFLFLSRRLKA